MSDARGAARPLQRFGRLRKDGFQPEDGDRWVGIQGMGGIVSKLAEGVNVRQAWLAFSRAIGISFMRRLASRFFFRLSFQDIWVPPSNGLSVEDGSWSVAIPGPTRATERFDAAVIAHNGKCAERLTSSTPAREDLGGSGQRVVGLKWRVKF